MSGKIRLLEVAKDAEIVNLDNLVSRRLVRKVHGSESMSFNVTTIHKGYNDAAVQYPEHDEIFYVLSGLAEIEFGGEKHQIKSGIAVLVPRGCRYAYRVLEGPNEMVAVFSPARA